jgi:hypothetical protein
MLYLRSINRFILISLALLGLSISSANASLFQFQFQETISNTSIAGLSVGQTAKLTVYLDNGGTSNLSQTWDSDDLQAVTFDFNNGGLLTTFNSPWDGGLAYWDGAFETDTGGNLISVMDEWSDAGVTSDYTTNADVAPFDWYLDPYNDVYHDGNDDRVGLNNVLSMASASSWNQVSAVPVPAAIWLFGTALIGLVGFGKRKAAMLKAA